MNTSGNLSSSSSKPVEYEEKEVELRGKAYVQVPVQKAPEPVAQVGLSPEKAKEIELAKQVAEQNAAIARKIEADQAMISKKMEENLHDIARKVEDDAHKIAQRNVDATSNITSKIVESNAGLSQKLAENYHDLAQQMVREPATTSQVQESTPSATAAVWLAGTTDTAQRDASSTSSEESLETDKYQSTDVYRSETDRSLEGQTMGTTGARTVQVESNPVSVPMLKTTTTVPASGTSTLSETERSNLSSSTTTSSTKPGIAARILEKTGNVAAKIGDAAYSLAHKAENRAEVMAQKTTGTTGTTATTPSSSEYTRTYIAPNVAGEATSTDTTMESSSSYQQPYTGSSTNYQDESYLGSTSRPYEAQTSSMTGSSSLPYEEKSSYTSSSELYQKDPYSSNLSGSDTSMPSSGMQQTSYSENQQTTSDMGSKTSQDPLTSKLDSMRINQQS